MCSVLSTDVFWSFFLLTSVLFVLRITALITPLVSSNFSYIRRWSQPNIEEHCRTLCFLLYGTEVATRFCIFPIQNPSHFFNRSINTDRYRDDILVYHIALVFLVPSDLRIFQQDNTHPHTAWLSMNSFNNAMVITLTWHATNWTCVGRVRTPILQLTTETTETHHNWWTTTCNVRIMSNYTTVSSSEHYPFHVSYVWCMCRR